MATSARLTRPGDKFGQMKNSTAIPSAITAPNLLGFLLCHQTPWRPFSFVAYYHLMVSCEHRTFTRGDCGWAAATTPWYMLLHEALAAPPGMIAKHQGSGLWLRPTCCHLFKTIMNWPLSFSGTYSERLYSLHYSFRSSHGHGPGRTTATAQCLS